MPLTKIGNRKIIISVSYFCFFLSDAVCGWVMNKYFDKKENWMIVICAAMTAIFLYFMYNAETIMWVVIFQCGVYFFKACILGMAVAYRPQDRHRLHCRQCLDTDQHGRSGSRLHLADHHGLAGLCLQWLLQCRILLPDGGRCTLCPQRASHPDP